MILLGHRQYPLEIVRERFIRGLGDGSGRAPPQEKQLIQLNAGTAYEGQEGGLHVRRAKLRRDASRELVHRLVLLVGGKGCVDAECTAQQ